MLVVNSDIIDILDAIYRATKTGKTPNRSVLSKLSGHGSSDVGRLLKKCQHEGYVTPASGVRGAWSLTKKGLPLGANTVDVEISMDFSGIKADRELTPSEEVYQAPVNTVNLLDVASERNEAFSECQAYINVLCYGRVKVQKGGACITYRGKTARMKLTPSGIKWDAVFSPATGKTIEDVLAVLDLSNPVIMGKNVVVKDASSLFNLKNMKVIL